MNALVIILFVRHFSKKIAAIFQKKISYLVNLKNEASETNAQFDIANAHCMTGTYIAPTLFRGKSVIVF